MFSDNSGMPASAVIGMVGLLLVTGLAACVTSSTVESDSEPFDLPELTVGGNMTLEEAIAARRSVRTFLSMPLESDVIGRLLWAVQGHTEENGVGRSAPSAGGTYPLEVYVATSDGMLQYLPEGHRARWTTREDIRPGLQEASGGQDWVGQAPAVFVITGVPARTEVRYGSRAERYVLLEAGHAAQNLLLQATSLELGAVPVGAFSDDISRILGLPSGERPLYLIPVGHPVD
jgi:SagB-type dehydrogenase family enzyme